MKRLQTVAALAMLVPTLASASVVWRGDLETGNLSQFHAEQKVDSNRLMVVTSPVREGRYALKTTVRQGDNPIRASGNRNELVYLGHESSGSEYFYKWSSMFPTSFPYSDKWALFTQWHQEGMNGSPPLEMYVVKDRLTLRVGGSSGKILWSSPLQREHWNDFILHVKWSPDSKAGFVELYHDGRVVVPLTKIATQFSNQSNYLKLGLYRDASIQKEGIVYHDGFVQSTKLADVMPMMTAEAPTEASTPAPETSFPAPETAPSEGPPDNDETATSDAVASAPGASGPTVLAPGTYAEGLPVAGCGASATGGMPLLVAGLLTTVALAHRRKKVPAPARRTHRR